LIKLQTDIDFLIRANNSFSGPKQSFHAISDITMVEVKRGFFCYFGVSNAEW